MGNCRYLESKQSLLDKTWIKWKFIKKIRKYLKVNEKNPNILEYVGHSTAELKENDIILYTKRLIYNVCVFLTVLETGRRISD